MSILDGILESFNVETIIINNGGILAGESGRQSAGDDSVELDLGDIAHRIRSMGKSDEFEGG